MRLMHAALGTRYVDIVIQASCAPDLPDRKKQEQHPK